MASVKTFEELEVWQRGRKLVAKIYQVTGRGSFLKDFALRDQLRRAAISIISNVAEGFERSGNREFVYFLYMAKGSAGEVRTQIYVATDLAYLSADDPKTIQAEVTTIARQISSLITYLNRLSRVDLKT